MELVTAPLAGLTRGKTPSLSPPQINFWGGGAEGGLAVEKKFMNQLEASQPNTSYDLLVEVQEIDSPEEVAKYLALLEASQPNTSYDLLVEVQEIDSPEEVEKVLKQFAQLEASQLKAQK
jgi:ribosomal protein L35AE/L33A